jgi:hypothetical protein
MGLIAKSISNGTKAFYFYCIAFLLVEKSMI